MKVASRLLSVGRGLSLAEVGPLHQQDIDVWGGAAINLVDGADLRR
jgi:hypothetical protein